jgi:hypothetical protein
MLPLFLDIEGEIRTIIYHHLLSFTAPSGVAQHVCAVKALLASLFVCFRSFL